MFNFNNNGKIKVDLEIPIFAKINQQNIKDWIWNCKDKKLLKEIYEVIISQQTYKEEE